MMARWWEEGTAAQWRCHLVERGNTAELKADDSRAGWRAALDTATLSPRSCESGADNNRQARRVRSFRKRHVGHCSSFSLRFHLPRRPLELPQLVGVPANSLPPSRASLTPPFIVQTSSTFRFQLGLSLSSSFSSVPLSAVTRSFTLCAARVGISLDCHALSAHVDRGARACINHQSYSPMCSALASRLRAESSQRCSPHHRCSQAECVRVDCGPRHWTGAL